MNVFRRFIYDLRLSYKLLFSYLVLTLIPMLFIFFFFQFRFVYRLENTTLDMEKIIVGQVVGSVESYIDQIIQSGESAGFAEVLQKILVSTEEGLEQMMGQQRQKSRVLTYMESLSQGADMKEKLVKGIRIYCEPDHPVFSRSDLMDYGIFESTECIDTSLWYGRMQESRIHELVTSTFWLNSWETENIGDLSYVKKIEYFFKEEKREAYVAVYFNRDHLLQALDGYGGHPHSCIYLVDEKDSLVAMEGQDEFEQYLLKYQEIEQLLDGEKVFQKVDYGDHTAWTIFENINRTGWRLVFAISEETIVSETRRDSLIFMGVYLVIAAALCVLMQLLSGTVTKRITVLRNQMQQVKEAPPKKLEVSVQRDEVGELIGSYNIMVEQINDLMKERIQLEMDVLRSQINPHFLYNTLDMISWYAVKGKTEDVTDSIQALAQFYRLSLNHGEFLTTLGKEIELLERYIELQCRRVACPIELVADIPEEMLEQQLPQFLLQPIVENSLKHGILEKEEAGGYITLTGWMEQGEMVLILADDGVGMDTEVMERLLEKPEGKRGRREGAGHIGIHNIYQRMQLFYGKDGFSMKYTSQPGEGTQVELRLSCQNSCGGAGSEEKL